MGMKDVSHAVPEVCRLGWPTELMGSIPTLCQTFSDISIRTENGARIGTVSKISHERNSMTSNYIELRLFIVHGNI